MRYAKLLFILAVMSVGSIFSLSAQAGPVSPAQAIPAIQSVQGMTEIVPIHSRSYWHCHGRGRVCRTVYRRQCVRWGRRGFCRRWVVRPVRRCWGGGRRYCHRR